MTPSAPAAATGRDKPICLAILAMGGQGGGVLSDWIVASAEEAGWVAQSTSVPGVAQRTGATIYYIEMLPARDGQSPVLSLMPTPGDVDVVMAAEFMEAGRAMLRGLVTPDRTVLIASTHRTLAIGEKEKPGNGIADSGLVSDAGTVAAKQIVAFDMQALAEKNGSVISATMFGALAGANVLPFPREIFETAIRAGGKGVESSLRAFGAGFEQARRPSPPAPDSTSAPVAGEGPHATDPALQALVQRVRAEFPGDVQPMVFAGVRRLTDYQDAAYAGDYLDRLHKMLQQDQRLGTGKQFALTKTAAKYLAVAMAYDDVIRVADLKTRATRFARVEREVGRRDDEILYPTEFMHPRMEEVAGTLPAGLGRWLEGQPALFRALDKIVNRGRRVRTGTISWFLILYCVAGLRRFRRGSLRHQQEMAHLGHWLAMAHDIAERDYDLGVEVLATRRLVKGYSDTHARGASKFDRVIAQAPGLVGRPDAAGWLRRLREAALADEDGAMLDGAIRTLETAFDDP